MDVATDIVNWRPPFFDTSPSDVVRPGDPDDSLDDEGTPEKFMLLSSVVVSGRWKFIPLSPSNNKSSSPFFDMWFLPENQMNEI